MKKAKHSQNSQKSRMSFRLRLILTVALIALVPLSALSILIINRAENTVLQTVGDSFSAQTQTALDRLVDGINDAINQVILLAGNPSVEQLVVLRPTAAMNTQGISTDMSAEELNTIMAETNNLAANGRTQVFFEDMVKDSGIFAELMAVNLDGWTLGASSRPERFVHNQEDWFQAALTQGLYVSDIQYLPSLDELGLTISMPIVRNTTGNPAGVLRALVPLTYITDTLSPLVERISGGELQLISEGQPFLTLEHTPEGVTIILSEEGSTDMASISIPDSLSGWGMGQTITGQNAIVASLSSVDEEEGHNMVDWELRIAQPTEHALAPIRQVKVLSYSITVAAMAVIVVVSAFVAVRVTRPLQELATHAQGAAEGQLRQYRSNKRLDPEIAVLANSMNQMTTNLARLLKRVHDAAVDVSSSSQQISAGMEEIAAGTQNQAQDVQAGTAQIEAMNRAMQQIDNGAQEANSLSNAASRAAYQGQVDAAKAMDGMREIKETVGKLGEQVSQIQHILGFIQDIADQTNLLALNAAIEAARAGENGRGFAVVAEEVRQLAERSKEATNEIHTVLVKIQTDAKVSLESVDQGHELVHKLNTALGEIYNAVESTSQLVDTIAKASVEQADRTQAAVDLFDSIRHVTEQTAAGAEETAAASQSLADMASTLQTILEEYRKS